MLKTGRWARKWEACRECQLSDEPHYAKGYCARCYMRLYKRNQRRTQRAQVTLAQIAPEARRLTAASP